MKLFFFDLETTGTNPAKHGIHQISGEIVINDIVKESFNFNVRPNPKAIIEDEALAIANVSKEDVQNYTPMEEVHKELINMLSKYVDRYNKYDKFHLVGFNNASFDNNFFRGFFLQNNDKYFGSWFWSDTIDVMCLASNYLKSERHKLKNFQLSTVAQHLGITVEEDKLHDAYYDIYLTKEIYNIVTNK